VKTLPYVCPMPPESMQLPGLDFARAEALEEFMYRGFLDRGGLFFDAEHGHLTSARIGILWASSTHVDKGSVKAGTAQLVKRGEPTKWSEAVQQRFMHEMFGPSLPVFKITLHAPTWWAYNDRQRFALLDHELLHCAQKRGEFGEPKFNGRTGEPSWDLRAHDYEGFAGTTERYGAVADGSASIVRAALKRPRFDWVPGTDLDIRKACGVS
jgi:hypothetical protein